MARHKTKLALTCSGPDRVTRYNPELNEKIESQCRNKAEDLFNPKITCIATQRGNGMCPFLEVKTYK